MAVVALLSVPGQPAGYRVPRPLDELVAQRDGRAGSPRSALDVQEIASLWDHEDPEHVLAAVTVAAEDSRTPAWVSGYAKWVRARLLLRLGRTEEAREQIEELGFIQQWAIVGPFDNDNDSGFEQAFGPEESLSTAMDLGATYEGRLPDVAWRDYPAEADRDGATSPGAILDPSDSACAYLATVVQASRPTRAALRLGADGAIRAWLNGEEVYADEGNRRAVADRAAAGVRLRRGDNRLVLKSCNVSGGWDLYARLTAPDGGPLRGVEVTADRAALSAAPPAGAPPFEVPSLWAWFLELVEPEEAPAQAHADLARFLARFGGDDPDEHRARDEALAAVESEPSADNLLLLAQIHPDRNRRITALSQALEGAPRRVDLLLALAGERMDGAHPEDALPLIERAEAADPNNPHVAVARADLLDTAGLTLSAISVIRRARERADSGRLTSIHRGLAARTGLAREEESLTRRYFESHRTASSVRSDIARRLVQRGAPDEAATLLREGVALSPLSSGLRAALSTTLEAGGDGAGAEAVYREALGLRPDDGQLHQDYARFLDRQGRADEAVAAAERSLALRPENPTLRQWMSVVSEGERFEEPYVEESAAFLARRGRAEEHDVHTLLDLRVRQVHRSGQSSEFRQVAFEAVTLQGARGVSRFQVAYAPDRQRLRIERARVHRPDGSTREAVSRHARDVYDPSVRMYYDIRVVTLLFGDLQPGDVVEVRYRLDDVAGANELGDYFGDLTLVQTSNPRARSVYALLVPQDRELVIAEPSLAGMEHRTRELDGGVVEHLFVADDVPPISAERGMPPLSEVAARIHVSTYSSWEALGRWYWSLVRPQLELDAAQRRRAEELAASEPDDLSKVRAIHRHVVTTVRYVALEFGVHRYKPYRVADVERRGFGDCKDQASLMLAMLEHVGVDAEIALVRTRSLGRIPTDPPSLEVFNHAIVYVPSLGMYIDPTAERVAVGNLPSADQGVTALRVSEGTVTLEQTPIVDAAGQGRHLELTVSVDGEGRATGSLRMGTTGWLAGATRGALDDPAAQVTYLERLFSRYLRGISVSNVRTTDLTELDGDTDVTVDVEVPGLGRLEGGELSLPVSIAAPLTALVSLPERRYPLVLGPPLGWEETLTITLPRATAPASLPAAVEVESPLGTFRSTAEQLRGGPVRIHSTLAWRAERVAPEDYPELRRFIEQVTAARTARIRVVSR